MPMQYGFNHILKTIDFFPRFAFMHAIHGKGAKEVAEALLILNYGYGTLHILQSDYGRELNKNDLVTLVEAFKIHKINGRPYHPQSQGRVERLNRIIVEFFKRTIYEGDETTTG
ncbi:KRAB-A domain-containing protein 2 [Elysia marginata]|uniref:KRAB-A domain-containing protein 2 n=1 Tax=Elysia marginata TaxID=1093978 RepID=A0AAV4ICN0_9GAST|nr:KRAB-A domain-containing protein 2 [Elysia marginata]